MLIVSGFQLFQLFSIVTGVSCVCVCDVEGAFALRRVLITAPSRADATPVSYRATPSSYRTLHCCQGLSLNYLQSRLRTLHTKHFYKLQGSL